MSNPRTCVSNIWLEPLTPRAYLQPCNLPYILSPLPLAHVRTWIILSPSYPFPVDLSLRISLGIFVYFPIRFLRYFFYMLMDSFYSLSFAYILFTLLCLRCPAKWFSFTYTCIWASHLAQLLKNHPAMKDIWVQSLGWEDMLRGTWRPSPVFLPGESHGQSSLAGYSP